MDSEPEDESFDKELDKLVKDGYVWATCPKCGLFLDSIKITQCDICKTKFAKEDIIFRKVDKEKTC